MPALQADRKVTQYLHEAHATEQALVSTLRAHIAMTPRGSYREAVETHLAETQEHARLVQERLRQLTVGPDLVRFAIGAAEFGVGLAETFTGQVLAMWKAPIDVLRGSSGEEKVLKNAKDECATEALEIATYDGLEQLARAVGDDETAQLAARIRRDEERFLARLREEIPGLAHAVVGAEVQGRGTYRLDQTGAADAVRGTTRRTVRAGRRTTRSAARQAEEVGEQAVGVATAAAEAAGEQAQEAGQRTARAARATRRRAGEQTERRSRSRTTQRASATTSRRTSRGTSRRRQREPERAPEPERAAEREPWPGYDEQTAPEIRETLADSSERTAAQVLEYEREHKDRTTVEQAAERELQEG